MYFALFGIYALIWKMNTVELPKTGLSKNRIPLKTKHLVLVQNIPLYV